MRLQDMKMDREFKKLNTETGTATKRIVLQRLGLKPETVKHGGYIMINGVPNKMVNGVATPMTAKGTRPKI